MTENERYEVYERLRLCVKASRDKGFVPKVANALKTAERAMRILLYGNSRKQDVDWRFPPPVWPDGRKVADCSVAEAAHYVYLAMLRTLAEMREAEELTYGDEAVYCNVRYAVEMIESAYDREVVWEERM